jgi:putative SOS response-associated peptidase YedK
MCYSAQIIEGYSKLLRTHGAIMSLHDFGRLFIDRIDVTRMKVPKAMEAMFDEPANDEERAIRTSIDTFNAAETARLEQELFKQRKRLADAERTLALKTTKAAAESKRIAADKVEWCLGKLADIRRTDPKPRDSRIFPGWYAPVMVMEGGKRVIKPMRYQCRPAGKPAFYDTKFPGTYNARRDNLEGFWKGLFGHTHGIMAVSRFFENVQRDGKNVVLEFNPRNGQEMLVACLWSRWVGADGEQLLSFAAITDEPPAEVAAAGHDRCIVPIKPENVDAWLNPNASDLTEMYAILDDRERPYYEHRLAA